MAGDSYDGDEFFDNDSSGAERKMLKKDRFLSKKTLSKDNVFFIDFDLINMIILIKMMDKKYLSSSKKEQIFAQKRINRKVKIYKTLYFFTENRPIELNTYKWKMLYLVKVIFHA